VGREVVKQLVGREASVVATALDAEDAQRVPAGAKIIRFDFGELATYPDAFTSVNKLFLMRPPQIADVQRYLFPVVDYARDAGVEQLVFLSLLGVERNPLVPHHKVEGYVKASGVPYTLLRPSFYMQNLNTTHREEIKAGEICIPVANAKTSFIDVRDIGAVAALVLTEEGHTNHAYALTGGRALSYHEVAEIFTEVLGKEVTYTRPSLLRFLYRSLKRGTPVKFALVMAGLYTSTRFGMADEVTSTVEDLLGRPPTSFKQYVRDYAEVWL
jgi:uncharacterized protein YbjT (DUF2867 family)